MLLNSVSVIGLGYIGLPTAALFASNKISVVGVDVNENVVNTINNGDIHITEPGLNLIVKESIELKLLKASTKPEPADVFIIAVPTPFKQNKSKDAPPEPDLSYVENATRSIAKVLVKGNIVILESTSPVGTTEKIASWLADERPDLSFPNMGSKKLDINIAYCPERVLPGNVIHELIENNRIIGGLTQACSQAASKVYEIFVKGQCIKTDARTAEMAKLTENASRDINIAFANELSIICDKQNINVWELINLTNQHPRVNILQPGPGVGGHCIAVDPWFIVSNNLKEAKLIAQARKINDEKPYWVINKVKSCIESYIFENPNKSFSDITISCYGLSFKANIDDFRESPSLFIAERLMDLKLKKMMIVEPYLKELPRNLSESELTSLEAASTAQIHLLLVDHNEFKDRKPKKGLIIDTRGMWS